MRPALIALALVCVGCGRKPPPFIQLGSSSGPYEYHIKNKRWLEKMLLFAPQGGDINGTSVYVLLPRASVWVTCLEGRCLTMRDRPKGVR